MREISQGPKCTSQIWKSAVIGLRLFPLKSAGVCGAGKRDESLRTSAWEANFFSVFENKKPIVLQSKQ